MGTVRDVLAVARAEDQCFKDSRTQRSLWKVWSGFVSYGISRAETPSVVRQLERVTLQVKVSRVLGRWMAYNGFVSFASGDVC